MQEGSDKYLVPQQFSNDVFGQNCSLEEQSGAQFCPTLLGATCSSVQTYCPALPKGQVHAAFAFPRRSSVECPRLAPIGAHHSVRQMCPNIGGNSCWRKVARRT